MRNIPLYAMVLDANPEEGYFEVMPLTSKNQVKAGEVYRVDPENLTVFPRETDMQRALEE